uniref:Uncharacterized protein n=1 Tax=Neobodo designis TaxID=312471 RepID=A0A7S1M174_NEODS|mmetsp:Transcript_32356/g.100102  ORF Transcript_32356/g.100102 Transcript_32356/m.100102 type:complete len:213 (+) Transcript_32356:32-670(+)|eukprot:CAMPEP_0174844236 /NCGR_PEP_ID=MMETSP1114-20130205/10983_1 /TAXON_ID=312471 /ORGANISM="Neobodo designis, Strain CCAP 1951/1" /LENGTH=212 /DNA_ID=CAMNT_0016078471 /DNA_START=29 /DNA_END=667 /DNA_ORIENTATION=+
MSNLAKLLHPAVDPDDKFDPTFLGVKRKRRLPEPQAKHEAAQPERGKHIDRSKMEHNRDVMVQLDQTYVPETFHGATKSTRFGAGFARRPKAVIGIDALREAENDRQELRMKTLLEHRRQTNASRSQTGLSHLFGGSTEGPGSQPLRLRVSTHAAAVEGSKSTVFSPPVTAPTSKALKRQERLQREGLVTTKKDWSVRQQFQALDGFVLPKV